MATIKEFHDGKTGVQVMVQVNHQNKKINSLMIDRWSNGYNSSSNGMWIEAWIQYKPDILLEIPVAGVKVSSEFKNQEPAHTPHQRTPQYRNKFTITVNKGNNSITFDYTASINDAGEGIVNLSDSDKINAFYCFIGDAIAGTMTCKEFASEFGYTDCCEAHRIHKLCKESTIKAAQLGIGDLYELSNKLQEVI
jgi:hypothetical protein